MKVVNVSEIKAKLKEFTEAIGFLILLVAVLLVRDKEIKSEQENKNCL